MSSIVIDGLGSELPTSPRDCVLLIAAPLDRDRFFADLERRDKEFARNFQRQFAALNDAALWRAYEPYASVAKEVGTRVSELGVRVIENVTLADFRDSLTAYEVTTLVGHWRSARFREDDIVNAAAVRAYIQNHGVGCEGPEWDCLNQLLDSISTEDEGNPRGSPGYAVEQQYAWQQARSQIEKDLAGAVRGGAAVEFGDGFHGIHEIVDGIPAEYAGTLDLTVCQSVMLGEEVKRKCRRSLVLTSAGPTTMDYRFALYGQVIEVLAVRPLPFEDATVAVRKSLIGKYGRKKKQ